MLQTVFEGKMPQHFDCEELMESLLTAITEESRKWRVLQRSLGLDLSITIAKRTFKEVRRRIQLSRDTWRNYHKSSRGQTHPMAQYLLFLPYEPV